jgi:hypothetical protein
VEAHLGNPFTEEDPLSAEEEESVTTMADGQGESPMAELYESPSADDETLVAQNAAKDDWISRTGRQRREQKGAWHRRKADFWRAGPIRAPLR